MEYLESEGLQTAIERVLEDVVKAVKVGTNLVILDEKQSSLKIPVIPALLITSALHHKLIAENLRTKCNVIVNTASARDNHQIACLIAFVATCVHPWLGLQTILKIARKKHSEMSLNLSLIHI